MLVAGNDRLRARRKSRGLRGKRRCKRFDDAEPPPSRLCERRERRCKRFHDVEPLPSRLCERRERRCKRFHGVEPLPSRLCERRERRCKRFHGVEPLPSRLCEHRERRCKRFHGVKPLAAPRSGHFGTPSEDRERLSSRDAPLDEQRDALAFVRDALLRHRAIPEEVDGAPHECVERHIDLDGGRPEESRVLALRVLPAVQRRWAASILPAPPPPRAGESRCVRNGQ